MTDDGTIRFHTEDSSVQATFQTPGDVVRWMRERPEMQALVENCYWDEDSVTALQRFAGREEFQQVIRILRRHGIHAGSRVLDLGAGNGIVTHAFRSVGLNTVALEPDRCPVVGCHALLSLNVRSGQQVPVLSAFAEAMPFQSESFDAVYCRQVLHHIPDLPSAVQEIHRTLRPGGLFLATREHVVDNEEQRHAFLANHPIHQRVGGENAYSLDEYINALRDGGFKRVRTILPMESVINYFPLDRPAWENWCLTRLTPFFGSRTAHMLVDIGAVRHSFARIAERRGIGEPGRMHSFVAIA